MNGSEPQDLDALFERALVSEGEAYLEAESRLRQAPDSKTVLQRNLSHPDPVGRLMASALLTPANETELAAEYLSEGAQQFAGTVAGAPPVRGILDNLSARFGGRLVEFLAMRLMKDTAAPHWRVMAILGYLDAHKSPAATDAVIRFATTTRVPSQQEFAAQVLAGLGDPALAQKLAVERQRLADKGGQLPATLAALA